MSIIDKLKKIRETKIITDLELPEKEKTGVLNGIVLLGAAIGTIMSLQHLTSGTDTPSSCSDTINDKVTNTEIPITGRDLGFTENSWQDHCWSDHCWCAHSWGAGGA